jgi:hypothetical protein
MNTSLNQKYSFNPLMVAIAAAIALILVASFTAATSVNQIPAGIKKDKTCAILCTSIPISRVSGSESKPSQASDMSNDRRRNFVAVAGGFRPLLD